MGDFRLPLTDKNVAGLALADKGAQYRARDTDLAGFFVLVGSRAKSFMIQADLRVLSHWGNDLRQSYRTLGQVAGVSDVDMHLLMNHSFPGVNAGYITRSKLMADHLRQQQEKISQLIVGAAVGRGRRPSALLSRWLNATSRAQLAELLSQDPDEIRGRTGSCSAMRKLEIQAARCHVQQLDPGMLDAPSRRLKTIQTA
jgi:hypothetical protein